MKTEWEDAKRLLQSAETFADRVEAADKALAMGMSLSEIEQYLDSLDARPSVEDRSVEPPAAS